MRHYPLDQHAHDPPCRSCKRKGRGDIWHHPDSKDIWSESESEGEGEGEREDENEREDEAAQHGEDVWDLPGREGLSAL